MSNETRLFSSLLNETMAADSREEERVGGRGEGGIQSGDCIKQPLEIPL